MIDWFRWGVVCALVLQFAVFATVPAISADHDDLVIGYVHDVAGTDRLSEPMGNLGRFLQGKLPVPVNTRGFSTEGQLFKWMTVFGEVDVAWLSPGRINSTPVGELFVLANPQNQSETAVKGQPTAHQRVPAPLRKQISTAFINLSKSPEGQNLLSQVGIGHLTALPEAHANSEQTLLPDDGSVEMFTVTSAPGSTRDHPREQLQRVEEKVSVKPVGITPPTEQTKLSVEEATAMFTVTSAPGSTRNIPKEQLQRIEEKAPVQLVSVAPPVEKTIDPVIIGYVEKVGAPQPSPETVASLSTYLQDRISVPVIMRGFPTEEKLVRWLTLFGEIDVAWLSKKQVDRTPVGELFILAENPERDSSLVAGTPVAHQRLDPQLREKISTTLAGMDQTSAGRDLLEQLKISRLTPPTQWQPPGWEKTVVKTFVKPAAQPVATPLPTVRATEVAAIPEKAQALSASHLKAKKPAAMGPRDKSTLVATVKTPEPPTPVSPVLPDLHRPVVASKPPKQPIDEPSRGQMTTSTPEQDSVLVQAEERLPGVQTAEVAQRPEPAATAELFYPLEDVDEEVVVETVPAENEPVIEEPTNKLAATPERTAPVLPVKIEAPASVVTEAADQASVEEEPAPVVKDETLDLSGKKNLITLIGSQEIPVLASIDGAFVRSIDDNRLLVDDRTDQIDQANLNESLLAGRNFNRESQAAIARTEQARAKTGQAFSLLLPSLSVRYSTGSENSKPSVEIDEVTGELVDQNTHTRTDMSLTIRQPLFDLPSFLDWRRRKVIERARGENYRISDGDAYTSTIDAYLSLVSSRLQTDMLLDFEDQLSDLLTYIEKRTTAGAASVSDMARVKARSEETLSSRLEQESAHAAAWVEFVRLTNLAPQTVRLPVLEDIGATLVPASFDRAVEEAMQLNPEISALAKELEAAKIDKSVAKSRYLPRLEAEYTDTYSEHAGGDPSDDGQRDRRAMLVFNWDLFSGGRDYQLHTERASRHKELQYRLDDQRRRVVQALSANYATLKTTNERLISGYQELESISTAAEAMTKRMLTGNQSLLDLLDVYDRLYRARSRLVSLHTLEMNTVAQLVRLTRGTPWAGTAGATVDPTADALN